MNEREQPLVGREAELTAIGRALEAVQEGRSHTIGLIGEAGIGKSRLLGELGLRAAGRGHLVLAGRAAELERDAPFALWVEALDREVKAEALARSEDVRLADLAVALPAVSRVAGVAPAATVERHRVAGSIRGLLDSLAKARPVTVLLDDVHWADPASADVIALLLHRLPERAVLLALAARAGRAPDVERALHAAARHDRGEVVEVAALSREAADSLVPASVGPEARARLYRDSGGNPFYLQALLGASEPVAVPAPEEPGVPRVVLAALAGEIAMLDPAARVFAQGAAVAGDPFEVGIATAAAGMRQDEVLDALDASLVADLVRSTDRPRRFRFRHPLVRRAVYETAAGGWRLGAHARAARALAVGGATAAERAHHVARSAEPGDTAAVELLTVAAEQTAATAPATAAGWYEAALRLLPGSADHDRRVALLRAQGMALVAAGHAFRSRDVLRQVLAMLAPDASGERVAVAVTLAGLESTWTQRPDEARRLLYAERDALGDTEPRLVAAVTLALASERSERGDHAATEALAEEACATARAAGDRGLEAAAVAKAADAAHCRLRGDDPDALAAVDAKLARAGALVDALPDDQADAGLQSLISLGIAYLMTGRFEPAHAASERGLRLARRTRRGLHATAFISLRGVAALELGRLDAAEADEEEALESALLSGNLQVQFWASIGLAWPALARGRVEAALEHGQAAWDLLGTGKEYSQAGFIVADGRLAAGDPQGALAAMEAFDWVRPQLWTLDRVKAAEVAVRVSLALGRIEEAQVWAQRAPVEGGGRRAGVFGAILACAEAAVLLARGAAPEAARIALAGAAAAEQGGAPLWAGRCRTLAGEALAASGRRDDARGELRRAAAELDARGAWGYRDAALRVLRRLGDRPRPPSRRDGHERLAALSPREREVAELVADGQTNAQIAARLNLSESTVEKHVSSVLRKLGMSSRSGVVGLIGGAR